MNRALKYFTWTAMLLASLILMSASWVSHNQVKAVHTTVKAASKTSFEFLAEIEEDETETRVEEFVCDLPYSHFLYSVSFQPSLFHGSAITNEETPASSTLSKLSLICVFRI